MAMEDGGGVYISSGTVSMSAGTVYNNQAENRGGGIFVYQGSLTLAGRVTIQQNSAATSGGGLYLATPSTTTFNGCTISGNQAPTGVGYYKQNGATINPLKIDNQDGFNEGP
jgi:predicted outer membrane repeat protein